MSKISISYISPKEEKMLIFSLRYSRYASLHAPDISQKCQICHSDVSHNVSMLISGEKS